MFLLGTVLTMVGGALGNVLLPSLVKKWFPDRTGLLVGAYSTALAIGGAVASVSTAPIAEASRRGRLALGPRASGRCSRSWRPCPGSSSRRTRGPVARRRGAGVRLRALTRSRLAWAMASFFGLQAMEAYVVVGWTAQYLRDQGMSASRAGVLVGRQRRSSSSRSTPSSRRSRCGSGCSGRCWSASSAATWPAGRGCSLSPLTLTWLWVSLLGLGMGTFAMVLTLIGLRGRTPESVAALSTVSQGWGYALAGAGPLLVGLLRGHAPAATPGCSCIVVRRRGLLLRHRLGDLPRAVRRRRGARAVRRRVPAGRRPPSSRSPAPSPRWSSGSASRSAAAPGAARSTGRAAPRASG